MLALLLFLADPLHARIDRLLDDPKASPPAADAEFLRRAWLDLAGTLPDPRTIRAFLDSKDAGKRAKVIDALLADPRHPRRLADLLNVALMERFGDDPAWDRWLLDSATKNRPWDAMASDILGGTTPGASFWLAKRLANYGQNPVDHPALARDVGRLFLGKDLRCAQCHDHLFIPEYKQADFQGLFAFVKDAHLADAKTSLVGEKPATAALEFNSVFGSKAKKRTGPRVPGLKELDFPVPKKGDEWLVPPSGGKKKSHGVLKRSPLAALAQQVSRSRDFARNMANRVWAALLGRGLVHPLDLHHDGNPPSHPALLDLLAEEVAKSKHDLRFLLREIALTKAYARSSELPEGAKPEPASFRTALEKRLSAEQLHAATIQAMGAKPTAASRQKFLKA
ncbi:MAG: DUF1549 and DUF1553 domain-containing protein, partial [Gemmataceae bacterium]|nr:DUF1549 and DUF1553 domain-containing protein [Gemmataceae bacterium]